MQHSIRGTLSGVQRGCKARADCPARSFGPKAQICESSTNGEVCTQCDYGKLDTVHKCKELGNAIILLENSGFNFAFLYRECLFVQGCATPSARLLSLPQIDHGTKIAFSFRN